MFRVLPNGRLMGCTLMNATVVVSCTYSITNWTFVARVFCFWTIHCEERANLLLIILERKGCGHYFFPFNVVTLAYTGIGF